MSATPLSLERFGPVTNQKDIYFNQLIYGPPGAGKTLYSASAPKPLIIDIERGGTKVLRLFPELAKTVHVFTPDSYAEIEEVGWEARRGRLNYETYVIDTGSELQRTDLDEYLFSEYTKNSSSRPMGQYLATQQDYNLSTQKLRILFLLFRDLNANFIVTAHDVEEEKTHVIRPSMTPKLTGTLISMVDLVGYLTADSGPGGTMTRKMITTPKNLITAKNRLGIPAEIKDPTWIKVLNGGK